MVVVGGWTQSGAGLVVGTVPTLSKVVRPEGAGKKSDYRKIVMTSPNSTNKRFRLVYLSLSYWWWWYDEVQRCW